VGSSEILSLAARRPYSLTGKTSFYDVPTSQFTHFVHELASSTSQSLLGVQPPNPCLRTSTNVLHTNVYLVFFFSMFKVHLNILLPVSFKICPRSLNFNNNSVSYSQNNMSSTSSSLIQFRSTYSHFYSTPIIQAFYRYAYSSTSKLPSVTYLDPYLLPVLSRSF